jgi:hypothetical protein
MIPTPLPLPCPVCQRPTLTCRVVGPAWCLAVELVEQRCGCALRDEWEAIWTSAQSRILAEEAQQNHAQ